MEDIDRKKARVWAFTNANIPVRHQPRNVLTMYLISCYWQHAIRVLRILEVEDQIDDIVFCDYSQKDLVAKPEPAAYHKVFICVYLV
jgi:pyrimidine and pyridine-specific 5'-nucleotidase